MARPYFLTTGSGGHLLLEVVCKTQGTPPPIVNHKITLADLPPDKELVSGRWVSR